MIRKVLSLTVLLAICCNAAFAGHDGKDQDAMMQAMMNCSVCKTFAPHMAELMPLMACEIVTLNNGMAMIHSITDKSKVATYQAASTEMQKAGAGCMEMTDADAKTKLCPVCTSMRGVMKAGASLSCGMTKTGDVMMLTSEDPKVQAEIAKVQKQFEMMLPENMKTSQN